MTFWQDFRYAGRTLRKSPGFTLGVLFTLALGIGANTAVFSVADAMLWKPVPLPGLERLMTVLQRVSGDPNDFNALTPADYADLKKQAASFQSVSAWQYGLANIVSTSGEPERVSQILTTADFFETAGVKPVLGRSFLPGEDQPGREQVVLLSDALWRRSFGADPGVLGKTVRLDDLNHQIIGVMPPGFTFPVPSELWTPIALTPEQRNSRTANSLFAVARLQPGASPEQASAELETFSRRLEREYPITNKGRRLMLMPLHRFLIGEFSRQYVLMLVGAVFFVLLIACANVSNLQFARATGRLREIAVRTALGASRTQVVRQLLTESVLVAVAGAAAGLVLANWSLDLIRAGMPPDVEKYIVGWKEIHLDARALAFTLALAVLAGILAGLAPGLQTSTPNLNSTLKDGGRGASTGRGRHRLRSLLVVAQVALAVVLLVGASLMVRGLTRLLSSAASLEPETLLTLRLALTENKYREPYQVAGYYRDVLAGLAALPGVQSAAAVSALPRSGHSRGRLLTIEGKPPVPGEPPSCQYQVVSPNYFQTLHLPLREGRWLGALDSDKAPRVGLISERMARRYWPEARTPIGKRVRASGPDTAWITIVGVVGDVRHSIWEREPRPVLYVPYTQAMDRWMDIAIRAPGDPARLAPAATAAIRAVDPEQPISGVKTMARLVQEDATGLNYVAVMMGIFGLLALSLSSVGVYGVMAYTVTEQTHEIGVRMALGAQRRDVLALVLQRGLVTTFAGLAIGLLLAFGMSRLLANLVYGVTAGDPATFTGIPLALLASALVAVYVPARRATRVDPIRALHHE